MCVKTEKSENRREGDEQFSQRLEEKLFVQILDQTLLHGRK